MRSERMWLICRSVDRGKTTSFLFVRNVYTYIILYVKPGNLIGKHNYCGYMKKYDTNLQH